MSWRTIFTTARFGMAAGTLYFIVVGLTAAVFSVFGAEGTTLLQLVLFIGVGAGLGLALGLIVGVSLGFVFRVKHRRHPRVAGALAGGVPVLLLTGFEYLTGTIGVLDREFTTVVLIPTAVAAIGSAALAPHLPHQG